MAKARIDVSREDQVTVIELLDQKIGDDNVKEVTKELFSAVEKNVPKQLLLCFSQVKHFNSRLLGTLIRLNKRMAEKGGVLKLCCIKPALYEMFVISQVNRIFDVYEDREQALSSFLKGG